MNDGQEVWSADCFENYDTPLDVFVIDGVVWTGDLLWCKAPGFTIGRDIKTGKVAREKNSDQITFNPMMMHHRCYRNKAAGKYILTGRNGIEFIDTANGMAFPNHWVRGTCQYGVMPANGLVYAPPHSCACSIDIKLTDMNALSAKSNYSPERAANARRLTKGPAYGKIKPAENATDNSWPMYRHDPARSGANHIKAPANLKEKWRVKLNGDLTQAIVADAKVFVVKKDKHEVVCLDAETGDERWSFSAGAKIDSAPSYFQKALYFGSSDGHVYCLDADTGILSWKYLAAPEDIQICSDGNLESVWPVAGAVLIHQGKMYAAAGLNSIIDGGVRMVALDPGTGRELSAEIIQSSIPHPSGKGGKSKKGHMGLGYDPRKSVIPDVMSAQGERLFMRQLTFDTSLGIVKDLVPHLFCSGGLLDDSNWHRTYWQHGVEMSGGYSGWPISGNQYPAGRILVFDDQSVYGYGSKFYDKSQGGHKTPTFIGEHIFKDKLKTQKIKASTPKKQHDKSGKSHIWSKLSPNPIKAMVLLDDALVVASMADLENKTPAKLQILSSENGETLLETKLPENPVFDGVSATKEQLLVALSDGSLACFSYLP